MASFVLTETATDLTYTGVADMAGYTVVVQKDDTKLDVREIVPADKTTTTWQQIRDNLAALL